MPYYRRRSRWPYRSWRRRSVYSAQVQGTRRFSVVIPIEGQIGIPFAAGQATSSTVMFCPFYSTNAQSVDSIDYWNHWGNLVGNNLFQTYSNLYDEVKISGVSLSLAVMSLPQGSSCKIYTSVDRRGTFNDISSVHRLADMLSTGEVMSSQYTSLDRAKMYRRLYARDIAEKTTFVDCTIGTVNVGNPVQYVRTGLTEFLAHTLGSAFAPIIYMCVQMPTANNTAGVVSAQVAYTAKWSLTFRNPKYAISGANKFEEMKAEAIEDMKEGESEVSEGSALRKKVKFEEPIYEESVIPDDEKEDEMDDESSQPELTKEEILELLKKYEEKKS